LFKKDPPDGPGDRNGVVSPDGREEFVGKFVCKRWPCFEHAIGDSGVTWGYLVAHAVDHSLQFLKGGGVAKGFLEVVREAGDRGRGLQSLPYGLSDVCRDNMCVRMVVQGGIEVVVVSDKLCAVELRLLGGEVLQSGRDLKVGSHVLSESVVYGGWVGEYTIGSV